MPGPRKKQRRPEDSISKQQSASEFEPLHEQQTQQTQEEEILAQLVKHPVEQPVRRKTPSPDPSLREAIEVLCTLLAFILLFVAFTYAVVFSALHPELTESLPKNIIQNYQNFSTIGHAYISQIRTSQRLQHCMNAVTYYGELFDWVLSHVRDADMFLVQSVVTCGALFWLLHRAWQTLWKPVPELISILGLEVPDPPAVTLTGIGPESVSLAWMRPGLNKPVVRYLIQVNGVNVGESSRTETAITVTGLKPSHFYNVRVIAVGSNNFQAGSRVIRLRTYGRDGVPESDCGRLSSSSHHDDQEDDDDSDNVPTVRSHGAGIETSALPESSQGMAREPNTGHQGQRRNTGNTGGSGNTGRKHSPSSAAADQALIASLMSSTFAEETMQQLTERYQAVRKDQDETNAQGQRDTLEFKNLMAELIAEKEEKRQLLNQKEEASDKLRKESQTSERLKAQAQFRKTQKEKILREKSTERRKMRDEMARWERETEEMKKTQELWQTEMEALSEMTEKSCEKLRNDIRKRQSSLNRLEEEIKLKGLKIKELEEERQHLPGAQNYEARDSDIAESREDAQWESNHWKRYQELVAQQHSLQMEVHSAQATFTALSAHQATDSFIYQGNSSGVDFDPTGGQSKVKPRRSRNRKSRTSTISSPISDYPTVDSPFPNSSTYNNPSSTTFAPGPYFDMSHAMSNDMALVPIAVGGMSEADIQALTAGAPLSPTATSLLPSNIFADDDPPSPYGSSTRAFGPALYPTFSPTTFENDPQSPGSSSRSASLMSSPQASSHNLSMFGGPGRDYGGETERRSQGSPRDFGAIGSPASSENTGSHKFKDLFSFHESRNRSLPDGPALGSLKQGQSQSFPRSTEEPEVVANRHRRISFSSVRNGLFNRGTTAENPSSGNMPVPTRNVGNRKRRGFNVFGSSIDDQTALYAERDPSSPRPVSIASSDLPRPSTDSAPFGWPVADGGVINRNSPLGANWSTSVNVPQTWSTNPSRRPSFQHGTGAPLTSGIASEDDEFLPPDTITGQSSPPPIGVIGTRPTSSHKPVTPKLNPAAPTFRAMFTRPSKVDKDNKKSKASETQDDSSKEDNPPSSGSKRFRGTPSVHTQNSVADSIESLERIESSTLSEITNQSTASAKESSFKQLLRKGSSSKFSLSSIRGKDSSLFGGKKGGSSAANSDRNTSTERDGSFDCGEDSSRTGDSVTSSPMIGSLDSGEFKSKDERKSGTKEGRMSVNWGRAFGMKKRGGGRESLDVDRDRSEAETTGTEDEGGEMV